MGTESTIRHSEGVCQEDGELRKRRQRWAYGSGESDNYNYQIEYIPVRTARSAYKTHVTCPERDNWFIAITKVFEACELLHDENCADCCYLEQCVKIHDQLSDRARDRLLRDDEALRFITKFLKMRLEL